jgi:hypothetical protein
MMVYVLDDAEDMINEDYYDDVLDNSSMITTMTPKIDAKPYAEEMLRLTPAVVLLTIVAVAAVIYVTYRECMGRECMGNSKTSEATETPATRGQPGYQSLKKDQPKGRRLTNSTTTLNNIPEEKSDIPLLPIVSSSTTTPPDNSNDVSAGGYKPPPATLYTGVYTPTTQPNPPEIGLICPSTSSLGDDI